MLTSDHKTSLTSRIGAYQSSNSSQTSRWKQKSSVLMYRSVVFATLIACIAGCGGGGGGGDSVPGSPNPVGAGATPGPTSTEFLLKDAYVKFLSSPVRYEKRFSVVGERSGVRDPKCDDTLVLSHSAPDTIYSNGIPFHTYESSSTFERQLAGCAGAPIGSSSLRYFTDDYQAIGRRALDASGAYSVYKPPLVAPRVADPTLPEIDLSTENSYAGDAQGNVLVQQTKVSYLTLPDTATSVLARFIYRTYDAQSPPNLVITRTETYRLSNVDGSFVQMSDDLLIHPTGLRLLGTALPQ